MQNEKPYLLGISGSLRKGSYNTAILRHLSDAVADRAHLTLFPLNGLPGYDGDLDTDVPPDTVAQFRYAILRADGLVISSPEYNYGLPGVLKNALDWASRPYGKAAITGKPVLTLTASPAFTGGVRAQAQLNEVLTAVSAQIVLRPQTVVGLVHEKVKDDHLDGASLQFLVAGIDDLLRNIRRNAAVIRQNHADHHEALL